MNARGAKPNGWNSPQIIIAIISLLMASGGSYLALGRDRTEALQSRISAVERDIAGLARDIEWLKRQQR